MALGAVELPGAIPGGGGLGGEGGGGADERQRKDPFHEISFAMLQIRAGQVRE
jgi:hypothetical protein